MTTYKSSTIEVVDNNLKKNNFFIIISCLYRFNNLCNNNNSNHKFILSQIQKNKKQYKYRSHKTKQQY